MVMPCSRSAARPSTSSAKSSSPPCVPTFLRVGLERGELVLEDQLGVVEQPADQRALAVVDAAAGDEAQQALVLVRVEIARRCPRRSGRRRAPSEVALLLLLLHRGGRRRGRSRGPAARRCARQQHLLDDLRQRRRVALDRAGQRVAAERAEADRLQLGVSPGSSGMRSSSTMISVPSRSTTGRSCGEVERHDRDALAGGCTARCRARSSSRAGRRGSLSPLALARVVEVPQLGALVLRVPAVLRDAEGEDALLGAATSPRRGARRRTQRRSRTCRAPASAPRSS